MITAEAIELLLKGRGVSDPIKLDNGRQGVVVPHGFSLEQIAPIDQPLPENIQQDVTLYDEASLVAYIKEYKSEKTKGFAAPGFLAGDRHPYIWAAIDYHEQDQVNRNQHIARYRPRYSDEWKLWINKGAMNQTEFAEFIEENRHDITQPTAAELLDLARNFKASRKIQYDKTFTEKDGTTKLTYNDETEATGEIVVPDQIKIGIPVYFNGPRYAVEFWVRYRVGNGTVSFNLKPDRADVVEKHAFDEMATRVQDETEIPVYLGMFEPPLRSVSRGDDTPY